MKLWQGAALVALFVLLSGLIFLLSRPPVGEAVVLLPPPTESPFVIDVAGAVVSPGLYALPRNCRLYQAVEAAGGLLDTADRYALNMASKLVDGSRVYIPFEQEEGTAVVIEPGEPLQVPGEGAAWQKNSLININTATQVELETLPSIGPSMAQKIIEYRQEHGPFQKVEELLGVPGIGPATFEKLRDLICVVD